MNFEENIEKSTKENYLNTREKEFFTLREEIMAINKSYNDNLRNMVAIYPLISTFSWEISSPYFQFIPMLFVILIYFVNQSYWKASCKIATYINIVLKDVDIQWERLHPLFDSRINKMANQYKGTFCSISPHYYIPLLASLVLAVYKAYVLNFGTEEFLYNIFFIWIIVAVFFLIFIYARSNVSKLRMEYADIWQDVVREAEWEKIDELKELRAEMDKEDWKRLLAAVRASGKAVDEIIALIENAGDGETTGKDVRL